MEWLERIAEEKIREAMERGDFENLELAGKPLRLDANGLVPDDLRLSYKILKDAGFLPPEMELRKEIVTLKALLDEVSDGDEGVALARRINAKILKLNLLLKRSIESEDREVYVERIREKMSGI
jgi:hypothetical protein